MTQATRRHQLWLSSRDAHTRRRGLQRQNFTGTFPARTEIRQGCLPFDQFNQDIPSFLLLLRPSSWGILGFHVVILGLNPKKGW